jgi:hypothetical protein
MEQGTGGNPLNEEQSLHSAGRTVEGIRSEAPAGATEQNQVEQGMNATQLIGEEHQHLCGHTMENLEGLTEKVGTLGLQVSKKIAVALPENGRGRPSLRRLLRRNRGRLTSVCRSWTTTGIPGTWHIGSSVRPGACGIIEEVPAE